MLTSPAHLFKYTYYVPLIIVADVNITEALNEVNIARKLNNCNPLVLNNMLSAAAQAHSNKMDKLKKFEHSDLTRITSVYGYNWSRLGENILYGNSDGKMAVQIWLLSKNHRDNLLNCNYVETGIGRSGIYWTQLFAKPL